VLADQLEVAIEKPELYLASSDLCDGRYQVGDRRPVMVAVGGPCHLTLDPTRSVRGLIVEAQPLKRLEDRLEKALVWLAGASAVQGLEDNGRAGDDLATLETLRELGLDVRSPA
jgi:hypothetical protein